MIASWVSISRYLGVLNTNIAFISKSKIVDTTFQINEISVWYSRVLITNVALISKFKMASTTFTQVLSKVYLSSFKLGIIFMVFGDAHYKYDICF